MKVNYMDTRTRFLFENSPIRGLHVRLKEVWHEINQHKTYPQAIRHALGELQAAVVLLASNLKFNGTLIAQIQGKGLLKMLVAEATSHGTCRATARWDEQQSIPENMALKQLLGEEGIFVLTLQPNEGEIWQGIVTLTGDSIAEMLMAYMKQSEQLDTFIQLTTDDEQLSGLMLQKMPGQMIEEDDWQSAYILANTLTKSELISLSTEEILYRLYHDRDMRILDSDEIQFSCSCSREKVADMLLLLGGEEVTKIICEQGTIQVACDFCGRQYVFDENDANDVFGMDIMTAKQKQ